MIKYKLNCKNCEFSFDSWFASSKEYEKLKKISNKIKEYQKFIKNNFIFNNSF